jgi:hypothetical protein
MNLDFSKEDKVVIRMRDYLQGILDEAPDDMSGLQTHQQQATYF